MTGTTQDLTGRVALVSGGSRGIGAAIVRRLADRGASVAVNYRSDRASADALVSELRGRGCRVAAFRADVSDPAQATRLVAEVVEEFGRLDALASNAGVEHFGPWSRSPWPTSTMSSTPTSPASCSSARPRPRR